MYHIPEIAAFAGNGGSKINEKIQQLLRKMISTTGIKGDLVGEAVGKGKGSPRKRVNKGEGVADGKKRKRTKVDSEDEEKVNG